MDVNIVLVAIGAPVVRAVGGWLENALEDGKISEWEWGQLGQTVVRVGLLALAGYFGLDALGIDSAPIAAAAGAFVLDHIILALRRKPEPQ